ncbi:hypothetical protein B0H63DRAFT_159574 [Podospora didyma]|uniref:Uncharacterized protein n=1 Tax=Podospora didyma TaxID=330526 RepID=A0AAE0NTP4_9PEZI|nr:hypothetical protein B0H63DRAFT_159574 [Podospora didyma]
MDIDFDNKWALSLVIDELDSPGTSRLRREPTLFIGRNGDYQIEYPSPSVHLDSGDFDASDSTDNRDSADNTDNIDSANNKDSTDNRDPSDSKDSTDNRDSTELSFRHLYTPRSPNRSLRKSKRLVVPIVIEGSSGCIKVTACPDTGSDKNIISQTLALDMGLVVNPSQGEEKFEMANGRIVEAIGEVTARCSFEAGGGKGNSTALECLFYVFRTLAVPAILGLEFLAETETHTKYRDRMVEELIPPGQVLRVNLINKPKRHVVCQLDTFIGCASTDTGSDLDLVSPRFVASRDLHIEPVIHQIQFADGSYGLTEGRVSGSFSVGHYDEVSGFTSRGEPTEIVFYLLDNLTSDILLGEDTVVDLDIFNRHSDSFLPSLPEVGMSELNIIRYIGKIEGVVSGVLQSTTDFLKRKGSKYPELFPSADTSALREPLGLKQQRENARREEQECNGTISSPTIVEQYLLEHVLGDRGLHLHTQPSVICYSNGTAKLSSSSQGLEITIDPSHVRSAERYISDDGSYKAVLRFVNGQCLVFCFLIADLGDPSWTRVPSNAFCQWVRRINPAAIYDENKY